MFQDVLVLKHRRLITLCILKIASDATASRMKHVLSQIISESETGFLKGRFI